jgi:hypothetical protein
MSLYNYDDDDIKLQEHLKKVVERINLKKATQLEPFMSEQIKVHKVIMNFIKTKSRKIYGGFAINALLKDKDESVGFYKYFPLYDSTDFTKIVSVPDIDFYSPDPIADLIDICNKLQDAGLTRVEGKSAQHEGSYTIFVNFVKFCDLSYIPKRIYDRIPCTNVHDYCICRFDWIMIDYLRMFSDPMLSYFRLEDDLKAFKRFNLLMQYYPFFTCDNFIKLESPTDITIKPLQIINTYLTNKESIITVGYYAFNAYIHASNILKSKNHQNVNYLPIPCYEFISINYKQDVLDLLDLLQPFNCTYKEFHSFVDYIGQSVKIYIGDNVIAIIHDNNDRCLPYNDYGAIDDFANITKSTKFIRIGSFHIVLLYSIVMYIYARTYKEPSKTDNKGKIKCETVINNRRQYNEESTENLFKTLAYQLLIIRSYYFKTYKKHYTDDTVFQDFTDKCIGLTIDPGRKQRLLYESRHKAKKRTQFKYNPSNNNDRENIKNMKITYPNISGNVINNPINSKLNQSDEQMDDDKNDTLE